MGLSGLFNKHKDSTIHKCVLEVVSGNEERQRKRIKKESRDVDRRSTYFLSMRVGRGKKKPEAEWGMRSVI